MLRPGLAVVLFAAGLGCSQDQPSVLAPPVGVAVEGGVVDSTQAAIAGIEADRMKACEPGLKTVSSGFSFDRTVDQLEAGLRAAKYDVLGRLEYGPKLVVITFDRPELTKKLVDLEPAVALDLPARFLIREDAQAGVSITWSMPRHSITRHDVPVPEDVVTRADKELADLAKTAAGEKGEPATLPADASRD